MAVAIFLGVVLFALLGHGYFWVAIVNRVHGLAGPRKFIDGTTLTCLLAFLALPMVLLSDGKEISEQWSLGWQESAGFSVRYLQFCIAWCVGEFLLKAVLTKVKNDPRTLRQWRREPIDNGAVAGADMYHGAYSKLLGRVPGNQSLQLCVDHKQIVLPRLHASHVGLRIAHVSDFHMTGRIDRAWFEMVVREVNRLEADVIAITGDIVEHEACLPWLAETLCQLEAKQGIYFIFGNHDKFVDAAHTRKILSDASQVCLSGRWLQVEWNGAPVVLAGNERPWLAELGDLENAPPRGADNLPLRLLLLHSPDQISWARRHDADLVLAGHTHGGQICFPILGPVACPSLHGTRYTDGVYCEGATVMHVTRGLSGRTPLRWLCPPEIALLELVN
jgi:predicted MPP superfamily phosphohydrolase